MPGGSRKTYTTLLPTTPGGASRIVAELKYGDETVTEAKALSFVDDREQVGVLSGFAERLPRLPDNVPLKADLGSAVFGVVGREVLRLGPLALDQYDIVVGDGAELAALSAAEREALFVWTSRGGRLLLDDAPGPIATLPAGWKVGGAARHSAGGGEIAFTSGAARLRFLFELAEAVSWTSDASARWSQGWARWDGS